MGNNRALINDKLASLQYNPKTVMVFNGTSISNIDLPAEERFDDSTYIVMTREKCSYEADFDIAVPSAYEDVTYPGALLVASNDLLDGKPQELAVDKDRVNITVDLPGATDISFKVVPTFANVRAGINDILSKWFDSHGGEWSLPANFQYSSSLVYDENELMLKFGCDISYLKQKLSIDFSSTRAEKKSVYLIRFKQIFYSVSAERPAKPADIFAESTTWEDLARAGISEEHPPLFVKNVQYGRQIFLKFESKLSSTELETTIKGTCSKDGLKIDANASAALKEKLSQIDVSIVVHGGSEAVYNGLSLNSMDDVQKINRIIWDNTLLSRTNTAAPLNYYTVFLKDGVSAGVHGTTEYVAEKTERYSGGEIRLEHSGWYVARFTVTWDEISYENGLKVIRHKGWEGNGKDRTAPFSTTIPLRGNARNISIKTEGCTGLAWEWWRTSGYKVGRALVPLRTVSIGGTTLHQTFSMTPAD
ncbi:Thiol-activated cytolysin [Desulfobulbus propionicus DSM 2032]|jgi:thiol-activated cytolysin|uniref:Thiol-activated cytolysin n=2 Tax=Desulfobulbus propionicus (strain ATCC 33891 / DSM 2032 / VKM B-1956 / 1pr3) TaxID=577650 RepID=A0A7U3YL07_DESPD|nr:thiol-activated cytolysin family protein [Desulfobulbus propionicus]ADW17300.1 Thiol-activated cytolysin [Desulfobulbus propionicus DSM 2032]